MSSDLVDLAAADRALAELQEEADFAEARFGKAHGESLRHYHAALLPFLRQAFDQTARAANELRSERDREGLRRHAGDIARHISADAAAVRARFHETLERHTPTGPGARHLVEAAMARGVTAAGVWWEGRFRLGTLSAPAVADRDWRDYRPTPGWVPWAIGGGVLAGTTTPLLLLLLI